MYNVSQLNNPAFRLPSLSELPAIITNNYMVDEDAYLKELISLVPQQEQDLKGLTQQAHDLVANVRKQADGGDGIDAFLQEYSLDTQEGVILMCLAEALLRIPDADTADALIKDKLSGADWRKHLKNSDSLLVNASTWGLMLTGKVIRVNQPVGDAGNMIERLVNRLGERSEEHTSELQSHW